MEGQQMTRQYWTINCQKPVQKSWDVQQPNYSWLTCSASVKEPQMWIWIPAEWSSHQEIGRRRFWTGPSPSTGHQARPVALARLGMVPKQQTLSWASLCYLSHGHTKGFLWLLNWNLPLSDSQGQFQTAGSRKLTRAVWGSDSISC